ncbi:MAG: FISUMP domain-containing protein [Bacteroidota bacterium]
MKYYSAVKSIIHLTFCLLIILLVKADAFPRDSGNYHKGYSISDSIHVDAKWNLLSLPAGVLGGTKNTLFPTARSKAFIYQGGYKEMDTLENGVGFWLKFDSSEFIPITGNTLFRDTIDVRAGWNISGSLTIPVAVNTIQSDPPGMIISQFYGYTPGDGYHQTDTIQPGKGYWVKVNQDGKIFLTVANITCPGTPIVTYSDKIYHTVQIGNRCWLKENLDVGTRIDGSQEQTNNSTIEKYCYNNDTNNCNIYGGLYQWNEAMQYNTTEGTQGICPNGWHVPTLAEYQTLAATVNNDGNGLKAVGQGTYRGAGTNTSGFSGLLAGTSDFSGGFFSLGYDSNIWSSTGYNAPNAY